MVPQEECATPTSGEQGDGGRTRGTCGAKGQMELTSQVGIQASVHAKQFAIKRHSQSDTVGKISI